MAKIYVICQKYVPPSFMVPTNTRENSVNTLKQTFISILKHVFKTTTYNQNVVKATFLHISKASKTIQIRNCISKYLMSFPADDRLIQHVVVVVTHVAINEIVDSQTSDLTCKAGNK